MTNTDGSTGAPLPPPEPIPLARPRYGEMAPPVTDGQPATPGYPQPAAPGYQQPAGYQQAPGYPAYPNQPGYPNQAGYPGYPNQPGYPNAYYAPGPMQRKSRVADVVVTCCLLSIGLIVTLITVASAVGLQNTLVNYWSQRDLTFHGQSALPSEQLFLIVGHLVLWVAAVAISIPLMVKRRIAFWVPLTAGVLAAIIFWGVLIGILVSDPAMMSAITAANGGN